MRARTYRGYSTTPLQRRPAPMESVAPHPTVEIIYRYPGDDEIAHKFLPWRRPQTDEALAEYIEDYFEMVTSGYRPKEHSFVPRPHCARLHYRGKVLAEWRQRSISPAFLPESLGMGSERAGQGGIPAVSPSAPCSERQEVPTTTDPCGTITDSVRPVRDLLATARLGQATLTTG